MQPNYVPKQPAYMAAAQLAGHLPGLGLAHDDLVALSELLHERMRQVVGVGYTAEHDAGHDLDDWTQWFTHEVAKVSKLAEQHSAAMQRPGASTPDQMANTNIGLEDAMEHVKHLGALALAAYAALYARSQETRRVLRDQHGVSVDVTRPASGAMAAMPQADRPASPPASVAVHPDGGLIAPGDQYGGGQVVRTAPAPTQDATIASATGAGQQPAALPGQQLFATPSGTEVADNATATAGEEQVQSASAAGIDDKGHMG